MLSKDVTFESPVRLTRLALLSTLSDWRLIRLRSPDRFGSFGFPLTHKVLADVRFESPDTLVRLALFVTETSPQLVAPQPREIREARVF
jgi:CelD/BcsL family acetyltransferase involved in cellulose biosynthesis